MRMTSVLSAPGPPKISSVLPYYSASSRELVKIDVDVSKSDPTVGPFVYVVVLIIYYSCRPFNVYNMYVLPF